MVKFITYRKKKYPVRISYYALKKMREELGNNISVEDFGSYEALLYHGLVSGARVEKKELTLKREEMEDVLDEVFMDFIAMMPEFFPTNKIIADSNKGKTELPKK